MSKTPKDLLRILKTNLEREAEITEEEIAIEANSSEHFAQATISVQIEGQTKIMNVFIKDLGFPSV